ncbi:MAG TPA: hypothetical protein VKT26_05465 [Acetobacteraceae bacterium]|nr:hypothetical protein [Acetobacteraceae bacterium]
MSAISAIASNAGLAAQINQAASKAVKQIDHDGDRDANKPETPAETANDPSAGSSKLNIKA